MKRTIITLLAVCGLACSVSCSGGGSADGEHSAAKQIDGVQLVPSTYQGKHCVVPGAFYYSLSFGHVLNNRGEVLLTCGASGSFTYVIWKGGDSFTEIPNPISKFVSSPTSEDKFEAIQLADNGAVVGSVYREVETPEDVGASIQDTPLGIFEFHDGSFHVFHAGYPSISRNGRYILAEDLADQNASSSIVLFKDSVPVHLAALPPNIVAGGQTASISNRGEISGAADFFDEQQSFSSQFGFFWTTSSFDLVPPPGRPELSDTVEFVGNDHHAGVITYVSGTHPAPDGNALFPQFSLALVLPDKSEVEVIGGDIQINGATLNEKEVVLGQYLDLSATDDAKSQITFVYSQKTGVKKIQDIFPTLNISFADALNDENQLLVELSAPTAEDPYATSLAIVQLPAEYN